jgi:radical SAM protein with 4Fe4S-binding SPASM domain
MRWLEISTNIGCPNNCTYCPQATIINKYAKTNGPLMMSFDTFKTCIDKVPKETTIIFSGMSEAWINPECTKMLLYAYHQGHKIFIYTSLIGMKPSDIDIIKKLRLDPTYGMIIHLPSSEDLENFNIDSTYLKTLKKMMASGINPEIHIHGKTVHPKIKSLIKQVKITKLQDRAGNLHLNKKNQDISKGNIYCQRQLSANLLLPNGDVLLCCQDYNMKHILGNLITDSYESLFNSKEYQKVKEGLQNEKIDILCRKCTEYARPTNIKEISLIKKIIKKILS